jgi:hypothetical protein
MSARGFDNKTPKLKWDDVYSRVRGYLIAVIWKDMPDMNMLNMHRPPAKGKFCDKHGKVQKSVIVVDYC